MLRVLFTSLVLFLVSCGGGGAPTSVADSSPKGLYLGSSEDGREIRGIVLGDGTYYFIYSDLQKNRTAGVVQGGGMTVKNYFVSADAVDFNIDERRVSSAGVLVDYANSAGSSGALIYASGDRLAFTTRYQFESQVVPSLTFIAGTYLGDTAFSLGRESSVIRIDEIGTLSAVGVSGCTATGLVRMRTDINAYNVTMTFGGAPCLYANQTFSGVAVYDAFSRTFYAAAPTVARNDGFFFKGAKQ